MERAATIASSLEAKQDSGSGLRCQVTILGGAEAQTRFEAASKQSNDPPLLRVNTLGSGEDNMKLKELMELSTQHGCSLEKSDGSEGFHQIDETGVDVVHGGTDTTLSSIDAGQSSGNITKSPTMPYDSPLLGGHTPRSDEGSMTLHELTVLCTNLSNKVESLETELKQTKQTYGAAFTKLIKKAKKLEQTGWYGQNLHTQEGFGAGPKVTTANAKLNTASTFVSTASPQRHVDTTADDLTLAETLMEIRKSAAKAKGKDKMDETESPRKMKQREQCSEEDLPMKLVELLNQRKKFFAQQRVKAKRNKPMTPTQRKEYMSNYIKNQEEGYSIKQLKSLSFKQVKEIFETTMRKVQYFVPIGSELEVQRQKRAGQEVLEEPAKRQKIGEASGSGEESAKKEKELLEEELHKLLVIVPVEEVYVEALQVKYPIIDWEVYSEDTRRYWKIIRVGNHTEAYQIFAKMLKKFNRDDLVKLWDFVKKRFITTKPTDDKEKE
ncbi:hypothetical protein Tco_0814387 [Tanacetum coccineum]